MALSQEEQLKRELAERAKMEERQRQAQGQQSNALVDYFREQAGGLPFGQSTAFQSIIDQFASDPGKYLQSEGNINDWLQSFKSYGNTFSTQFRNLVGRDPTADEYNIFFDQVIAPEKLTQRGAPDITKVQQATDYLLPRAFSKTIEQAKQEEARKIAENAVSPTSPYQTWADSYRKSVSDTEAALADYQTRLFEKIRPQLLTSLQSQGLLNTGGLNEAFAGAAKDLSDESQRFVAGARQAAESDISNRRYDIQSQPTNFALQNTFQSVPNLYASGQNALQNVWNNYMLENEYRMRNQNQPQVRTPSLLQQYAGQILGGAVTGLASRNWGGARVNPMMANAGYAA